MHWPAAAHRLYRLRPAPVPQVSAIFNPGILLAQAVRGLLPGGAGAFFALLASELAGYFAGAPAGGVPAQQAVRVSRASPCA